MLDKKNQVLFYMVFQTGHSDNTIEQKQQDMLHYYDFSWQFGKKILSLQSHWFSIVLLLYVKELRGNAVKICDITRCCESFLSGCHNHKVTGLAKEKHYAALFHLSGKTVTDKDQVRRPAHAIQVTRTCGTTGIDGNHNKQNNGKVQTNL